MAAVAKPYSSKWSLGDTTEKNLRFEFTVTLTANYGGASSHGDTLDLSPVIVGGNRVPFIVNLFEAPPAGTLASGYNFIYTPGTTQKNGAIQILSAVNTEYTQASAYSAALLAAVIRGVVYVPAFV